MFLSHRGLGARWAAWFCAMSLMLLSAGCEPTSITEARNQLGRGPQRIVELTIPVAQDTVTVGQFLCPSSSTTPCDTATTNGLMGISFDPQTLRVAEGQKLKFGDVATFRFKNDISSLVLSMPGTYTIDTSYAALSVEPRLLAIDSMVADSGNLTFTTLNRMNVPLSYTVTLNGFSSGGVTLTAGGTVPAASGTGSYTSHTIVFNLASVTITPPTAGATLSVSFTVPPGGLNAALKDSTIIQSGTGRIAARRLTGLLDPAQTAELNVAVEEFQQVDSSQFNFGDFQDAVQQARLNDAKIILTVRNTATAPLTLTNFTLGVVKLTPAGQVPKDINGNIIYQTDSLGAITVPVVDPGQATLAIPRQATAKIDTVQAARLLDRIVDSALAGKPMAVVGAGMAAVGDGASSTIRSVDSLVVGLGLKVALDVSIPSAGVTFSKTSVTDGADLAAQDANQIATRVDTASATAIVQNGTPFGVQVRIAMVPDSLPSNVTADSIFRMSNRVELGPVSLAAGTVDAQGRVTAAVQDTATVSITGTQSRVLLGKKLTAAVRMTLLPSATNTRGAIRTTDKVIIRASGSVQLKSGGAP